MKIIYLLVPLLGIGCTTRNGRVSSPSFPELPFVAIYHEEEFLGAISIREGERTERTFERFVDAGNGEIVGLGVEIIAENFSLGEGSAKGRLEVTRKWIDPDVQDGEGRDPQFPVFSVQSIRSNLTLKAGSTFYVVTGDGEIRPTGYNFDRADGWRFLFVTNEAQNLAR